MTFTSRELTLIDHALRMAQNQFTADATFIRHHHPLRINEIEYYDKQARECNELLARLIAEDS